MALRLSPSLLPSLALLFCFRVTLGASLAIPGEVDMDKMGQCVSERIRLDILLGVHGETGRIGRQLLKEKITLLRGSLDLFARAARLGGISFYRGFGFENLILKLAGRIRDPSRREQVIQEIQRLAWGDYDGSNSRISDSVLKRVFFSLREIASAEHSFGVNPEEVHFPESIEKMLGVSSSLNQKNMIVFRSSWDVLARAARLQGVTAFSAYYGYGTRDLILKTAGRIRVPSKREQVTQELSQLMWTEQDGHIAKYQGGAALERMLFAFQKIAAAERGFGVKPEEAHLRVSLEKMLDVSPFLNPENIAIFESASDVLAKAARRERISFTINYGARDLIMKLAEHISDFSRRKQVIQEIQELPWGQQDGGQIKTNSMAAERILFSLQKIAAAERGFGVKPEEAHLRPSLERMVKVAFLSGMK